MKNQNHCSGKLYVHENYSLCIVHQPRIMKQRHFHFKMVLGLKGSFEYDLEKTGWKKAHALIISSHIPHELSFNGPAALFLLDPRIDFIRKINQDLMSHGNFYEVPEGIYQEIIGLFDVHSTDLLSGIKIEESLVKILKKMSERLVDLKPLDERIEKVFLLIKSCQDQKITLENLAQSVFLSPSRLIHLFKKETGIALRAYIQWHRLRQANKYIIQGKSLTDAAYLSGFSDSSHLTRTYQKIFGFSPSQILKNDSFQIINCVNKKNSQFIQFLFPPNWIIFI